MNKKKSTDGIPTNTIYCYTLEPSNDDIKWPRFIPCVYWKSYWNAENWRQIYACHYLDFWDEKYDLSLIWDQCKLCNVGTDLDEDDLS